MLAEAVEKNSTLRVLNVETNFISPPVVVVLAKALLQNMSVEEFRASNQVSERTNNYFNEAVITNVLQLLMCYVICYISSHFHFCTILHSTAAVAESECKLYNSIPFPHLLFSIHSFHLFSFSSLHLCLILAIYCTRQQDRDGNNRVSGEEFDIIKIRPTF